MKKLLFILSFLTIMTVSYGQIKLGVAGGLTSTKSPDFYTDKSINGLGMSDGYHLGLKAKLSIPLLPITAVGFATYYSISGENDLANTSQKIWNIGVGAQYSIIPGPLSPYISLEAASNNFGAIKYEYKSPNQVSLISDNNSISRIGIGIGVGAELTFLPVDIDVNIKYQMMNAIGKKSGDEKAINFLDISAGIYF